MTAFRRSIPGYIEVLKSPEVAAIVEDLAKQIAEKVDGQGLSAISPGEKSDAAITAVVDPYDRDRAAAAVTILHPAGLAMQARHGVFTKAAAAVGLEVKSK